MREFTKSMMSYTWAMSLFGVQQMVNVFRPSKAVESFDNVTDATNEELGDALKATFRAGDNLQKGLVDLTFSFLTLGMTDRRGSSGAAADLGRQSAEAMRQGMRAATRTAEAVGQTVQGAATVAAGAARQGAGWSSGAGAERASYSQPAGTNARTDGRERQEQERPSQPGWGPMPSQPSNPYGR